MAANSDPGWTVNGQQETTDLGPNGQFAHGFRVSFTTRAGHQGSVFVPDNQYAPDMVRALIAQRAQAMDAVGSLTG